MIRLINAVDIHGEVVGGIRQSDDVAILDMGNGVNQSVSIPDDARFAIFQNLNPAETLYAKEDVQGNTFSGIPTAGDGQELMVNPDVRQFADGQNRFIHLITTAASRVIVNFYN